MINLQLYVEIMRLGAEAGGGKSRVTAANPGSGWSETWQGAGKAQETIGGLSQARQNGVSGHPAGVAGI